MVSVIYINQIQELIKMADTPAPVLTDCEKKQQTVINLLVLLLKVLGVLSSDVDKAIVK